MTIKNIFSQIKFSIQLVHKHAKVAFYMSIISKLLSTSRIYVFAWINRSMLNELAIALSVKDATSNILLPLIELILVNWILSIAYDFAEKILGYFTTGSIMQYSISMNHILYHKLSNIDISNYDSPKERDNVQHAFQDMSGIASIFDTSLNIVFAFVSFVIAFQIVFSFNWIICLLVILILLPSFFIKKRISMANYKMERELTSINRKIEYYAGNFFHPTAAQDMRIFDLKNLLLKKHYELSIERNEKKKKLIKKNTKIELIYSSIIGMINGALNIYILFEIIFSKMAVGDFTYYSSITSNLRQSVEFCMSNINEMIIACTKVANHREFMAASNKVVSTGKRKIPSNNLVFEFKNVSFSYPNSKELVLNNLSFTFDFKQKIAFAGINGAGKTTIIKLLLRFYDPTEGAILLNGINIKEYDIGEYRKIFSIMFQSYTNYKMTIKENISMSSESSDEKVLKSLDFVGLNIDNINLEYSKTFDQDGIVLSTGQAQRLNLARTIYPNAPICILDEPSASLDAKAEQEIFDKVFEMTRNSGLILISHRLSNLQYVDKVVFLEQGKSVEVGSHLELLNLKGSYSELYNIQSRKYQSTSANAYVNGANSNSNI